MYVILTLLSCTSISIDTGMDFGEPVPLVDFVDPMIATGGVGYGVNCGYPGVTRPLGMVKISPDSATEGGAADGFYRGGGYHYDDKQIQGFSHMHLYATGITGHGTLAVMPTDGMTSDKTNKRGYGAFFDHEEEWASAGRYAVHLPMANVELSATLHTALHQYTFTQAEHPTLLIDVNHVMGHGSVSEGAISYDVNHNSIQGQLIMDGEMGSPYPLFFYGELDSEPNGFGIWQNEMLFENQTFGLQENSEESLGLWLEFPVQSTIHLRMAISNVDMEGAKNNFAMEHRDFNILAEQEETRSIWSQHLNAVQVWGGDDRQKRIFATALYHTLQMPTLYSDADGRYLGFDGVIHQSDRPFYSDFSLWDTYRTVHPLYTLLWPEIHEDLLWSLAQMSLQGNGLPRWPLANTDTGVMLGTSVNIVMAEAALKGLQNFDEDEWFDYATAAMLSDQSIAFGAPPDLNIYEELHYYPADEIGRSVAWTQEQSIADFALGQWALQKNEIEKGEHLKERSHNWRNLYDEQIGFVHGRNRDGSFAQLPSEDGWEEDFAEGNARQYLWLAPHDSAALFEMLGGKEQSLNRLNEMFDNMVTDNIAPGLPERWYWHGNEPTLHVPWFYYLLGDHNSGHQWIQWILENRYSDGPVGLAGNDDGGTLSAWAVFAMMGFYPLAGTTDYVIGVPTWEQIEFSIQDQPIRIQKRHEDPSLLILDGKIWNEPIFSHSDFGEMIFYAP